MSLLSTLNPLLRLHAVPSPIRSIVKRGPERPDTREKSPTPFTVAGVVSSNGDRASNAIAYGVFFFQKTPTSMSSTRPVVLNDWR